MKTTLSKYALYEQAVQSPELHRYWFHKIYEDLFRRRPHRLREDFCGTFLLSRSWVAAHPKNTALALDLDPEPLNYGKKNHLPALSPGAKKRLQILQQNVISVTRPQSDLIVACNFSFCTFKDRKTLIAYFKKCRQSLANPGALVLELAGGPGMIGSLRETKMVRTTPQNSKNPKAREKFQYIWDQRSFDPIQRNGHYAIHFKLADGRRLNNAFTYDWRMWTIPEVRDALLEAGYKETAVYWETEHGGRGTGEFVRIEKGDNAFSWVAYIAALKH